MNIEHRMLRVSLGAVVMTPQDPAIFGIPIDFILFGVTFHGVAEFHQHTLLAIGLHGALTSFREEPCAFGSAKVFASRSERRLRVAGHRVDSFEFPRQYCWSADRWRAGTSTLPGEDAHWLCRGNCCHVQRWRRVERTG